SPPPPPRQQPGAEGPLLPVARGALQAPQRLVVLLHRTGCAAALRELRRGGATDGGHAAGVVRTTSERAHLDPLHPGAQRRQPRVRAAVDAPRGGQPRVAEQAPAASRAGGASGARSTPCASS